MEKCGSSNLDEKAANKRGEQFEFTFYSFGAFSLKCDYLLYGIKLVCMKRFTALFKGIFFNEMSMLA